MNTKKHNPLLEDGSSSFRVGEKVANTDVNLAYFQAPDISPADNIRTIQDFMQENAQPPHMDEIQERERKLEFDNRTYPMWTNENGKLHFGNSEVLDYPNSCRIYKLIDSNVMSGGFLLSNQFSDDKKTKGMFYSYETRFFVYDENLSHLFDHSNSIHQVIPTSLHVTNKAKNDVTEQCNIVYEKIDTNTYKCYVYTQIEEPLFVIYRQADADEQGFSQGLKVEEQYIHSPIMYSSLPANPSSPNEYAFQQESSERSIHVEHKANRIPDNSLHIRWRISGTVDDKQLYTPWHYDTVGNQLKDVSYKDIDALFADYFPSANNPSLQEHVEVLNSGTITSDISSNRLRVRSNGTHTDIFPVPCDPTLDIVSSYKKANISAHAMFYRSFVDADINFEAIVQVPEFQSPIGRPDLRGDWTWLNIEKMSPLIGSDHYNVREWPQNNHVEYNHPENQQSGWEGRMHNLWWNVTVWNEFSLWVWVPSTKTVTWSMAKRFGHNYSVHFFLNNMEVFQTSSIFQQSFDFTVSEGWNEFKFHIPGLTKLTTALWQGYSTEIPLWQALDQAGYNLSDLIATHLPDNPPIVERTIFASKKGRAYSDPATPIHFDVTQDDFTIPPGSSSFQITNASIVEQELSPYVALHIDNHTNSRIQGHVQMTSGRAEPLNDNIVNISIDVNPHPHERIWLPAYESNSRRYISGSYLAKQLGIQSIAVSDPDILNNIFIDVRSSPDLMVNLRFKDLSKFYVWDKQLDNPNTSIFMSDISSGGDAIFLEHSSHYHELSKSKRHVLKYADSLGWQIDNTFGLIRHNEKSISEDNADSYKNWYVSIDAIGSTSKEFVVDWEESHPIYRLYENLLDFKGEALHASYSIPEYYRQNLDSTDTNEVRRKIILAEKPIILDKRTIKVRNAPLFIPGFDEEIQQQYIRVDKHEIESVDKVQGIIRLKTNISNKDTVRVMYSYMENKLQYRGFSHPKGFMHLDLNPSSYHTISMQNNSIPGHVIPSAPINDVSSSHLLGKMILLYLRPTELRIFDTVVYPPPSPTMFQLQGVHHTDMSLEELHLYDPLALPLGVLYIVPNASLRDLILIDTRSKGGGLKPEISEEIIRTVDQESNSFWDIGYWDGMPYQANGVMYLRLPQSLLHEYGGLFTKKEIEDIVHKHAALGVVPIITYIATSLDDEEMEA